MFQKTTTLFVAILFGLSLTFAQDLPKQKAPIKFNEPVQTNYSLPISGNSPVTAANYVAVDTMANAYGPCINTLNPLAFDPISNVLAVVYRGKTTYAVSSGEIWWSVSTDYGATWVRSSQSVQNGGVGNNAGRYPSMTIFNPSGSTSQADLIGAFTWPNLNPSAFGWLGYGASEGLDLSSLAILDPGPPNWSTNITPFTAGDWVYWTADNQTDLNVNLFRTQDYATIENLTPWNVADFGSGGANFIGGVGTSDAVFVGALASFTPAIGDGGWEIGYSKSTDNGVTWSGWVIPDWKTIPVTADYDGIWDWLPGDAFISVSGDIQLDKNGFVHLVTGLTDTLTKQSAIVEFYETAAGVWDAKIVAQVHDKTLFDNNLFDPGIGQQGPSIMMASNSARDFFAIHWTLGSPETADTLADLYYSTRALGDANWSASTNLTQTNGMNEDGAHLAPYMATTPDGKDWIFSMYWYEAGATGYLSDAGLPHVIYVAPVTVRTATDVEGDITKNYSFDLQQNYPNPFNPSTSIKYTIAERSNVSIKVFDMLGKEVATLINSEKESGSYEVNFNASDLASGLYIYTINAGNFTSSRKMMLLK